MREQTAPAGPGDRVRFRAALWAVGDRWETAPEQLAADVIDGLLAFGTETPENLAAAAQLDVAAEEDDFGRSDLGLCLKDYAVRLDHVLWLADGADIPEQVQERWPGLPQQEWDCALRVAKLVLSALGSPRSMTARRLHAPLRPSSARPCGRSGSSLIRHRRSSATR